MSEISHQIYSRGSKHFNLIGQSIKKVITREIERENLIEKSAETLLTLFARSQFAKLRIKTEITDQL